MPGRAPSRIRLFVSITIRPRSTAPDSHGMQKGLVGVVHAFADRRHEGANDIVIAHELLHTVGASDKYDLATGAPRYPIGYARSRAAAACTRRPRRRSWPGGAR